MGENFSGATEISDAVWKIEVSDGTVAYFLTNLLQNILLQGKGKAEVVSLLLLTTTKIMMKSISEQ